MEKFNYSGPTGEELEGIFGDDLPPEQRKRRIQQFKRNINGKDHLFQVEYEEVRPCVWRKVPGSEKDLGPIGQQ